MKRFVNIALLAALYACLCAGCGAGPVPPSQRPPVKVVAHKKKITFLHYFSNTLSHGTDQLLSSFNGRSPDYEIEATTLDHEAFKTSIYRTLEAGNPPDIYSYWAGARVRSILEHLEPIDDVWAQEKLDGSFSRQVIESACDYDGKKYLIPISQHFIAFFYNKKIFDRLGIVPPATWTEFLAACDKIKKAGVIPIALGAKTRWPAQFWFDFLLLRTAPFEFREKLMKGQASYTSPEVFNVFRLWSGLIDAGYFNSRPNDTDWESGANEMVYRGEAAMTLMGLWIAGSYSDGRHKWVAGVDYDCFAFPVIDDKIPTVVLGALDGLVIPKKAVNVAGAKKALAYLASVETQKSMSRGWGTLAPNVNIEKEFYTDMQRRLMAHAASASKIAFHYDLSAPPAAAEVGLDMFARFLEFPHDYEVILEKAAAGFAEAYKK